ncbi:MAG: 1-(5-phosphoribosyl)-5-[(5-phosphoribosylamino)methylideneamino] imidazole-4-carboxamide isomerase [Atopobiaceae bacterium]|jgi:phosphoribosylformimino-5-aminoimidazole carboxamide ribotide isomerase|nr:1-(5-phosphoribosyl)-5-[(5-phosphoribosylamino)methylideneamino] imidazole-4-carboxamide isomerase [Atopobiaceae bacterium]MCH4120551.1 1-(5-phosphoribosyl)-5-[(5-phosphoribosylamino)methylideneamino] imidazole-4-carboxamide isomerase [Atopobiaceae bacterium]MCI1318292.1 1-(5-phosphoribosyl)-5-[(5-phosphoribosylamino)methylideneamino] imidazole-4-carboxamide isomerase [Atopobiaceae bacterium]MCI1389473.1 1-(5-phosphoribosyl)-5-[(5-phosphoribosylamino)methylideneamino] imidazole-4-carboxamide 
MIVFPAIDLIAGKVVRLAHGDRARMDVYSDDPLAVARSFAEAGATWVHVVDLSSAFGEPEAARAANDEAIRAIAVTSGLSVDVGGGVRSLARLEELLGCGCKRVAMGTALVRDPGLAGEVAAAHPEAAVADVAARDGEVRVDGWRDGAGISADELVGRLSGLGFRHLVFTDVARDGMQTGIDVGAYRHVSEVAGFPVVASGGIASLEDIRALAAAGDAIEGCIVGRALYEGAFTLEGALAAARDGASQAKGADDAR